MIKSIEDLSNRFTPGSGSATLWTFSVLFGLLAAALSGYVFGTIDHAEQLPIIYRLMDADYLVNDFQSSAASGFGPRFYFAHAVAAIGGLIPIPALYAFLYLLVYIAITAITAFAARDLTGSTSAAIIAATVAGSSVVPFALSAPARVTDDPLLIPRFLAMPFALYALWRGVGGRPITAALASVPAIFIQPTMGIEVAALALAGAFTRRTAAVWGTKNGITPGRFWDVGFGALIVAVASLFWIAPALLAETQTSLDSERFVDIYAVFRHPRHLIPGSWELKQFALCFLFVASAGTALFELQASEEDGEERDRRRYGAIAWSVACIFGIVVVGCVCGYVFVEIIPTRLFAVAQPFRLTIFLVWIGWIFISRSISRVLEGEDLRWGILYMVSVISSPTLALYRHMRTLIRRPSDSTETTSRGAPFPLAAALMGFCVLFMVDIAGEFSGPPIAGVFLLLIVGFAVAVDMNLSDLGGRAAMTALAAVLVLTLFAFALDRAEAFPEIPAVSSFIAEQQPAFTLDDAIERDADREDVKLAMAAKLETEPDALILIPWKWTRWRLYSERAVVVDWKFFPFSDEGMSEWYDRYQEIYEGAGYPDKISKSELIELHRRYGFDYAVLPVNKLFGLPVVAKTEKMALARTDGLN